MDKALVCVGEALGCSFQPSITPEAMLGGGVCSLPASIAAPMPHRAFALWEELKICRYYQHHVREMEEISLQNKQPYVVLFLTTLCPITALPKEAIQPSVCLSLKHQMVYTILSMYNLQCFQF